MNRLQSLVRQVDENLADAALQDSGHIGVFGSIDATHETFSKVFSVTVFKSKDITNVFKTGERLDVNDCRYANTEFSLIFYLIYEL